MGVKANFELGLRSCQSLGECEGWRTSFEGWTKCVEVLCDLCRSRQPRRQPQEQTRTWVTKLYDYGHYASCRGWVSRQPKWIRRMRTDWQRPSSTAPPSCTPMLRPWPTATLVMTGQVISSIILDLMPPPPHLPTKYRFHYFRHCVLHIYLVLAFMSKKTAEFGNDCWIENSILFLLYFFLWAPSYIFTSAHRLDEYLTASSYDPPSRSRKFAMGPNLEIACCYRKVKVSGFVYYLYVTISGTRTQSSSILIIIDLELKSQPENMCVRFIEYVQHSKPKKSRCHIAGSGYSLFSKWRK